MTDFVRGLGRHGYGYAPGLTADEFAAIEDACGFRFPPDLRALLERILPVGATFPKWRGLTADDFQRQQDWLIDGILFDVLEPEFQFWLPAWGDRPLDDGEAELVVRAAFDAAPTLLPVYAHRFIPTTPAESGNPVFSVMQTDIIVYGSSLPNYFRREFGIPSSSRPWGATRTIPFWTDIVDRDFDDDDTPPSGRGSSPTDWSMPA
ncbi:MAG: SMI1/KNR4 family protein [Planctomycetota bacterium]